MLRARFVLLLTCLWLVSAAAFAAGIPIRGRTLDSGGAALAKVRVRLVPVAPVHAAGRLALEGKDGPEPVASAESAADGSFLLEAPEPGMWKVIAGGEGLVPQQIEAAPLTGELDLPSVRLQRDAGLAVRVLGSDGKPVPGAWVRIEPTAFSFSSPWQVAPRLAITDAEGRAVLPRTASMAVTVRAGASGFGIAERKEVRAKTLDLRLPTGPAVPLRVLGADGKPAAGVLVLRQEGGSLGMTGEDGLLDLVAPGGAPLDLLLLAADGRQLEARARPFQAGEPRTPRELRLPVAGEAVARVVSAADSRPLAGALVWRTDDPGSFRRTDARGETRLPAPSERGAVQSAAAGFLPEVQEIQRTQEKARRPLAFSLKPYLAVTGVVVDEAGSPVAGAEITSSVPNLPQGMPMLSRMQLLRTRGAVVRSGPDGRFRWGGLVAGLDFELRVTKTGFAPTRAQATAPAPERPAAPLRIVLRRGRSAFGRVLGPDQRPIAGAQVTLKTALSNDPRSRIRLALEPESLDSFSAATGTDGRFDLGNLPTGRYDLTVRGRGWAPLTVPNLEVPEGNRATDLGTVVLAPGVTLEGFVVDAAGKPVEGAEIRLTDAGDPFPAGLRAGGNEEPAGLSAVDGSFRIEDLRAGSPVNVSVSRTGFAPGDAQGVQVPADPPIRLVLQTVGTVSGRVVDPDGKPIAEASVNVDFGPGASRGMVLMPRGSLQFDRSDAEGNFRITNVIPGPIGLSARAPGWQEGSVAGLELRGGEEKSGIEIVLSPSAILKGRVLAPSGRALSGAQVQTIFEDRAAGFANAITDSEGLYVLDTIAPGNRTLEASHPDHGTARRQVELRPGENSLDFTLEGGSEVTGRVVDDAGRPVAGAQVVMTRGVYQRLHDTSAADGSFRFAAVADGAYEAFASKEGFAPPERVQVTVSGSSVGGIEIRLSQGGAIVGRIAGLEASELLRVQVSAQGSGRGLGTAGRIEPDGSYRIDHLREGEWRVRAELPGTSLYAEGVARLEPGASEARLDLEMERGLELSGRVRRNGAPATSESLFLEGSQRRLGQTDSDGRFRFQGLAPGSYRLRVGGRADGPEHEETVDLQADREITIDLSTGEVSGRVVDAADTSPLANATVQILAADSGSAKGNTQTDSQGAFALRGVAEGSWRLRALADGYAPGEVDVRVDRASPADGVEIALQGTEGVTLQVATAAGPPPRSLRYSVLDGAGREVAEGTAVVGDDGRARLSRVPPGSWQVLLLAESAAATEIAVTAPGDAGRLTLAPACPLRVRVRALENAPVAATVSLLGAGGRPYRAFRMGEPATAWDLSRGAYSFQLVPPGTWEVQVTAADGRTWRTTVTTTPGAEAEVVLE